MPCKPIPTSEVLTLLARDRLQLDYLSGLRLARAAEAGVQSARASLTRVVRTSTGWSVIAPDDPLPADTEAATTVARLLALVEGAADAIEKLQSI